jgi:lysophospholipase L1-like esterase
VVAARPKQILVYSDSLAWGIIPDTRRRLGFGERWPGVMEASLVAGGHDVRVIEDALNGRRSVFEDPYKPGRNGLAGIAERIEAHSPLVAVVIALGTNDFQVMHDHDAWISAQGIAALVDAVRRAPIEPAMPVPPVLVVAPPPFGEPKGTIAPKFRGAAAKSQGLAAAYEKVASEKGCAFLNAGSVTSTSKVDGVHLDADQHLALGRSVACKVAGLFAAEGEKIK